MNWIGKLLGLTEPGTSATLTITIGTVSYTAKGNDLKDCREIIFSCMNTIKTKPIDYVW